MDKGKSFGLGASYFFCFTTKVVDKQYEGYKEHKPVGSECGSLSH